MSNYHAKGQKDGSQRKYNPPHGGILREAFGLWNKRELNDRQQYKDGYCNAKKQRG